jgi:hypothetical protein
MTLQQNKHSFTAAYTLLSKSNSEQRTLHVSAQRMIQIETDLNTLQASKMELIRNVTQITVTTEALVERITVTSLNKMEG